MKVRYINPQRYGFILSKLRRGNGFYFTEKLRYSYDSETGNLKSIPRKFLGTDETKDEDNWTMVVAARRKEK